MNSVAMSVAFAFATIASLASTPPPIAETLAPGHRGGRVGWARLFAPGLEWERHSRADGALLNFVRSQTSLNLDPTWQPVEAERLDDLVAFPLIFAHSVVDVTDAQQRSNLREYVRRGGFLVVDPCRNPAANTGGPDVFLDRHVRLLTEWQPDLQVQLLAEDHPIYHDYFSVRAPILGWYQADDPQQWRGRGLYGVFVGQRMIALISLSGLQCGWDGVGGTVRLEECMKMLVNIYIYAMTR